MECYFSVYKIAIMLTIPSFVAYSNFTFVPEMDNVGDYSDKIPEKTYKKVKVTQHIYPADIYVCNRFL